MDTSVDNSVTIIIATYIRYEALNLSLQSVYSQTYTNWKVLIIADCCDAEFISNVDLSNEKVQLINLPQRCGNQYGPNSPERTALQQKIDAEEASIRSRYAKDTTPAPSKGSAGKAPPLPPGFKSDKT